MIKFKKKDTDKKLKDILEKHNIEYTTVKTTEATDIITDHILDILNEYEVRK